MKIKLLYSIIVFFLSVLSVLGQVDKLDSIAMERGDIQLLTKQYGDSIVLRWGYDQPELWYATLNYGVKVSRKTISPTEGSYEELATVKVMPELELEALASKNSKNEMLFVVLQHTYRDWENSTLNDDGDFYGRSSNFINRWSLVHFAADRNRQAAEVAGMRYVDKNVTPGHIYSYKVEALGKEYASDYSVVSSQIRNFVPVLENGKRKREEVVIEWDRNIHDYHYSGYFIERSSDGNNFQVLNDIPYVMGVDDNMNATFGKYAYIDSISNDQAYFYRFRGVDAFGDISIASNIIKVDQADVTPPPSPFILIEDDEITHLSKLIEWEQSGDVADIATYHLVRSKAGKKVTIRNWATPDMRKKVDRVQEAGVYTYRLIAEDAAGNQSLSNEFYTKLHDALPPAIPTGLTGTADTTGIITLIWDEHPEPDVIGYYVYAADGTRRDMQRQTGEVYRARIYLDTVDLNTLNEKRYYSIVAIDKEYKTSAYSDTILVDRPDVIPPAPTHIADYEVSPAGIQLKFIPSSSRDVVEHRLYRKGGVDTMYKLVKSITDWESTYMDTDVESGETYTYKFVAIDEAGLESNVVKEPSLTAYNQNRSALELQALEEKGKIILTWTGEVDASSIFIFRSKNGGPFITYRTLSSSESKFTDFAAKKDAEYAYRIQAASKSGVRSPFSNLTKITLK